ncbi:YiiX/YebB-like N1pC/P60 family cysteine hydrolase [Clostridiaceae bacterium M8S5]|nr:YiiX/YebB-like N1pC/P60 family cysteine hydrolase [Clostridiaceae bacterium M8S5]
MKRFISGFITMMLIIGLSNMCFANSQDSVEVKLQKEYEEFSRFAYQKGFYNDISLEDFISGYNSDKYTDIIDYVDSQYKLLAQNGFTSDKDIINTSPGTDSWHYNTGTKLPQKPSYKKYKLLDKCKKGDIVYEAKGMYGIIGHSALVEGKFYDPVQGVYYIRLVEGLSYGVSRSLLDDKRLDDRKGYIYRIKNATYEQKCGAVKFCLSQLGKNYKGEFSKDLNPEENDWYCSELVWAGYMNQGLDIETKWYINEPGVSPRDITMYSSEAEHIKVR